MSQDRPTKRQQYKDLFREWFPYLLPMGLLLGIICAILLLSGNCGENCQIFDGYDVYSDEGHPCVIRARTWIDQNRNGKRDEDDNLLPGVKVWFDGVETTSDSVGRAQYEYAVGVFCREISPGKFSEPDIKRVSAEAPTGYQFTTPAVITLTSSSGPIRFGFIYLPGVPTVTPKPTGTPKLTVQP